MSAFGRKYTVHGLCHVCADSGWQDGPAQDAGAQACGCSERGLCAYHMAASSLSPAEVKAWTQVGEPWEWERKIEREERAGGTSQFVIVDAEVAGKVAGREGVERVTWLPDGRAEVWYRAKHEQHTRAPQMVSADLAGIEALMYGENDVRTRWTRYAWRADSHKAATAKDVCRACGALTSALRTNPHECGERLDARGRAMVSETRKVGAAALGRARFAVMRGREVSESDRAAIEAAGFEVPTMR